MTVPLEMKFPEAPENLQVKTNDLVEIPEDNKTLSGLLETVTINYSSYYECKARVDGWQEWYSTNKKLFEEATK